MSLRSSNNTFLSLVDRSAAILSGLEHTSYLVRSFKPLNSRFARSDTNRDRTVTEFITVEVGYGCISAL